MRIPAIIRAQLLKEAINSGLKLLTWDIETSHMLVRSFYIGYKVSISHKQIKVPSKVISIQYKWAHESEAKYLEWDRIDCKYDDARNFDDSGMITEFVTNVLSKADVLLTQNGDKFDFMVLNERAKALNLPILDQKPSIDILKLSRKSFRAASHKLDYRSSQQGLGGKITMIDQDWVDIEENNIPATAKMIPYGLKDALDTEALMWKELSYYKDLPVSVEKAIYAALSKDNPPAQKKEMKPVKEPVKYCARCRLKHRPSRDLRVITSSPGADVTICNNCNSLDHIKTQG